MLTTVYFGFFTLKIGLRISADWVGKIQRSFESQTGAQSQGLKCT